MMRWSKMSRHFMMSVVRMQSSNLTTTKLVFLDEPKISNKSTEHNIVAAAFASLKEIDDAKSKKSSFYIINNKIDNATTVNEILAISEIGSISKQHALKVIILICFTQFTNNCLCFADKVFHISALLYNFFINNIYSINSAIYNINSI